MTSVPAELRREYQLDSLSESQMTGDPFAQFEKWFNEALRAGVTEPNAMTLATADLSGKPSARIVLLKGFDPRGFMFFTNYQSRKGREMHENPQVALCLHWQLLERQVRIEGKVEKVSRHESTSYFHSRPREAQIGAWASQQSEIVGSRDALEQADKELSARFEGKTVPLPDHWGGYRVIPEAVEFWQGRLSRLHDRLQYARTQTGWELRRLSP